jgi:hypothetical protein
MNTIDCPHCHGRVGHARGQTLEEALEKHIRLSHTVAKLKPNPAPDPFAMEAPAETPVTLPKLVRIRRTTGTPRPARRSDAS